MDMMVSSCPAQTQTRLVNKGFQYWSSPLKVFLLHPAALIPVGCGVAMQCHSYQQTELHTLTHAPHYYLFLWHCNKNIRKPKSNILKLTYSIHLTRSKACCHSVVNPRKCLSIPVMSEETVEVPYFKKVPVKWILSQKSKKSKIWPSGH